MRTFLVIFLLALCGNQFSNAQFEDLSECVATEGFFAQFLECLFGGFGGLDIMSIPDLNDLFGETAFESAEPQNAGRKLQSTHSLDTSARRSYVKQRMDNLGVKGDHLLNELKNIAKWWSKGQKDTALTDRIKQFNLRELIGDAYLIRYEEHFTEILQQTMYLRNYAKQYRQRSGSDGQDTRADPLCDLLGEDLCNLVNCLGQYPESAFEDGIDWLQCLVTCEDIAPLVTCSADLFATVSEPCKRVQWFSDILVGIMSAAFNKTSCNFHIESPTNLTNPIELTEGGEAEIVEFKSYIPPAILCMGADPLNDVLTWGLIIVGHVFGFNVTCDVEMQITTANYLDDLLPAIVGRPKCRIPNRALRQVAIGYHPATVNNSAVFKITPENWNSTFQIPLLPVVDHRVDGDVEVSYTMKLWVQGAIRGDTLKIPVLVKDTDPRAGGLGGPVECYSLNDPHIMTFDGRYYNNFYHGAFYLYKHTTLPYEVQAIYQPCEKDNKNATCNCAVAVRSGDDVFVIDRCRRKVEDCPEGICPPSELVVLYNNGELTPGTRVFRMEGGLRHDVVLPHGTIIRIVTSNDMLNVWIMPGSYDKDQTEGLCGTYNEQEADDFRLPDGSNYTGSGTANGEQPQGFSNAWRVPEEELIFWGALPANETFSPLNACHCTHILMAGASCECGRGTVTEICDLFLDNEYTSDNISSIMHPSIKATASGSFLDNIEVDEAYTPPLLSGWNGVWNETAAIAFCENLLDSSSNPMIAHCGNNPMIPFPFPDAEMFCKQDIQLLDNTNWKWSTLDSVKYRCFNQIVRRPSTAVSDLMKMVNSSCANECNGRGQCVLGSCECDEGFWGPDCRHDAYTIPALIDRTTQICDNRNQMCHFATIYGHNLNNDGSLRCRVKNIEISSDGVDYLPKRKTDVWESYMTVLTMNQAICPLPKNGSYEVSVMWHRDYSDVPEQPAQWSFSNFMMGGGSKNRMKRDTEVNLMSETSEITFIFISHDSACFWCDEEEQFCRRKEDKDHCWVKDTCYAPGQTKPDDPCQYCDPSLDQNDWIWLETEACIEQKVIEDNDADAARRDKILRGSLGGGISALIIIIVIVVFCVTKNKEKHGSDVEEKTRPPLIPETGSVYYKDPSAVNAYDNPAMTTADEADNHYDVIRDSNASSIKDQIHHLPTRVEVLRAESRKRTTSEGNESIRSNGSVGSSHSTMKTKM